MMRAVRADLPLALFGVAAVVSGICSAVWLGAQDLALLLALAYGTA